MKDIKIFLKKKKKKSDNMVLNVTQKTKKIKLVEYRKIYYGMKKMPY